MVIRNEMIIRMNIEQIANEDVDRVIIYHSWVNNRDRLSLGSRLW